LCRHVPGWPRATAPWTAASCGTHCTNHMFL
jgi:hypothetical protein